ncbi:sigma-54-dependent Fis family transcriptional regulator [candidate division KSB1 bacterium]|nr:sigma-54-dependent Fis family transcriptional regulator [candidate division KSB1 bacterium]
MRVLVIDDDNSTRKGIEVFLQSEGHTVTGAINGREALEHLAQSSYDLVISDVRMPEMDGLSFLAAMKPVHPDLSVLMMTAYATVEEAVKALQKGASDYLTKPLNLDELAFKMHKLSDHLHLVRENRSLKDRLKQLEFPRIIGGSPAISEVKQAIHRLSEDPDVPVIIIGESGTGKELVARTVHDESQRADHPFIAVNCAAFQDSLLESELFGHKKGAFTGAHQDKKGYFAAASKGTLFLDEVSEMSPQMQSKLLRVLQEQVIQPVGDVNPISVDVRMIGASNQDLHQLVQEGKFREDLFYRMNVIEIRVPPLRDRVEDIPILIQHFLDKYRPDGQKFELSASVINRFEWYAWPGNIRELENLVRRLLTICQSGVVQESDLPERLQNIQKTSSEPSLQNPDYKQAFASSVQNFEKRFFEHFLKLNQSNISKTAEMTGISRVSLHQKIKKYKL